MSDDVDVAGCVVWLEILSFGGDVHVSISGAGVDFSCTTVPEEPEAVKDMGRRHPERPAVPDWLASPCTDLADRPLAARACAFAVFTIAVNSDCSL
jgi:hypothetical protein